MRKEYDLFKSLINLYSSNCMMKDCKVDISWDKHLYVMKFIVLYCLLLNTTIIFSKVLEACNQNIFQESIEILKISTPQYPSCPKGKEDLEGFVKLNIYVDQDGNVENTYVVDSKPRRRFDRSAIRAVRKSSFSKSSKKEIRCGVYVIQYKMD